MLRKYVAGPIIEIAVVAAIERAKENGAKEMILLSSAILRPSSFAATSQSCVVLSASCDS